MEPDETRPPGAVDPAARDVSHPGPPRRSRHGGVLDVVAVGGMVGALARYAAGLLWPTPRDGFPWTTLGVNAAGCLVMGCFLVTLTEVRSPHRLVRPFFGTGVLGGFTTFSTYCVDAQRLVHGGRTGVALAYLAATAVAALAAVTAGARATRRALVRRSTP